MPCNHDRCLTPHCPHCGVRMDPDEHHYRSLMAHLEKVAKSARTRVNNEVVNGCRQGHGPNAGYCKTWLQKAEAYEAWAMLVKTLKEKCNE